MSKDQSGTGLQMVMNTRKPPLNDIRVRQAMLYAADQDAVNDILFDGYLRQVRRSAQQQPSLLLGAAPATMYKTDVKKAGELLDAAGWKLAGRQADPRGVGRRRRCRTARR